MADDNPERADLLEQLAAAREENERLRNRIELAALERKNDELKAALGELGHVSVIW